MGGRQAGEPDFARAYEEHVWSVYGFFAYRLPSREDAEDLTQLTFERALKAWGRYDSRKASIKTWLTAIAQNLLTDHYRRDHSRRDLSLDELPPGSEPANLVEHPAYDLGLSPELADALEQLGEREREILSLRYGGDMDGPEIAEAMGLSLANVHQITSRALAKLRAELEPAAESEPSEPGGADAAPS